MERTICELVLNIKAFGFFDVTDNYVYMRDTLENIDKFTSKYRSKEHFFNDIKKSISPKIDAAIVAEHGFSTTEIELIGDGVFIRKAGRNISPLYSHIGGYPLEDVILKRMYDGSLTALFRCDELRANSTTYDTLFTDIEYDSIDRIDAGIPTIQDVKYFWSSLQLSNRLYPTIRFLLTNLKDKDIDSMRVMNELYESFCELIPDFDESDYMYDSARRESKPEGSGNPRSYRYPYRDDN